MEHLRLSSGIFRNRKLKTLAGDGTRPTAAKIRSAIYDSLGQRFDGGSLLDLFSGSGAMAFEAISRGFDEAVCIDNNREAIRIIKENSISLKTEQQITLYLNDYHSAIKKLAHKKQFDVIIVDPPYAMKVLDKVVEAITEADILAPEGTIVLEYSNKIYRKDEKLSFSGYDIVFSRRYDTTEIMMLERENSNE